MAILWTEDLAVGVSEIDNQHKELFNRINDLLEACNQGKAKEVVTEVIKFLEDYVVIHFGNEEKYMALYKYPGFISHKALHDQFIITFGELKDRLAADGPGGHIVIMTNRVVVTWLNSHIRNVDKELGAFLKNKI